MYDVTQVVSNFSNDQFCVLYNMRSTISRGLYIDFISPLNSEPT